MSIIQFKDLPDTTTPITADNLNNNFTECNNIIESGSNANGNYIKYSDGTMICYGKSLVNAEINTTAGALYRGGSLQQLFPAEFLQDQVIVTLSPLAPINFAYISGVYTHAFDFFPMAYEARTAGDKYVHYMAIGRWK